MAGGTRFSRRINALQREPGGEIVLIEKVKVGGKMAKKLVPERRTLIEVFYMPAD